MSRSANAVTRLYLVLMLHAHSVDVVIPKPRVTVFEQ